MKKNKMNSFQKNIIKKFHNINKDDFDYFTKDAANKISKMGLPKKECIINSYFIDSNDSKFNRLEYCLKNCGLKCLNK